MQMILEALRQQRREFGPRAERAKLRFIAAAVQTLRAPKRAPRFAPVASADLRALHDEFLYLCAYADSRAVARAAAAALPHVIRVVSALPEKHRDQLANSGIAGTHAITAFSLDLLRWLAQRAPGRVAIDWKDDSAGESFDDALPLLVASAETDGVFSLRWTTRDWVNRAKGRSNRPDFDWVRAQFDRLPCPPAVRDRLFESLDLQVRWSLANRGPSRTFTRFPPRPPYYHRDGLQRDVRLAPLLTTPLPRPAKLTVTAARRLIDIARDTLAVRVRETDPVTYADPREVTLFRLERGIDVLLLGMQPHRRLPIESYFGYVAARNRVPVAYGGGWVFFERCEIGVNLFEEFRGGESAFIFGQLLRVYHQHYRASRFTVDPFQFGADNEEAIRSGAFWFYYRFGFRPREPRLRRLAAREAERIAARRRYRSPAAVLRRLAGGQIELDLRDPRQHKDAADLPPESPQPSDVGLAVTDWIGREFDGDRDAAGRAALRTVAQAGMLSRADSRAPAARDWIARLAPLAAMLPDLRRWSTADRTSLGKILLAKSGPRERDFALRLQDHERFRAALAAVAAERVHD